jgi:hypothetical protein
MHCPAGASRGASRGQGPRPGADWCRTRLDGGSEARGGGHHGAHPRGDGAGGQGGEHCGAGSGADAPRVGWLDCGSGGSGADAHARLEPAGCAAGMGKPIFMIRHPPPPPPSPLPGQASGLSIDFVTSGLFHDSSCDEPRRKGRAGCLVCSSQPAPARLLVSSAMHAQHRLHSLQDAPCCIHACRTPPPALPAGRPNPAPPTHHACQTSPALPPGPPPGS